MRKFKKFPIGLHVVASYVSHTEVISGPDTHGTYKIQCQCTQCMMNPPRLGTTVDYKPRGDMQGVFILIPADYDTKGIEGITDQQFAVSLLSVFGVLKSKGYNYQQVLDLIQEAAYQVIPEVKEYLE